MKTTDAIKGLFSIRTVSPHTEYISSLRGISALLIVTYHVWIVPRLSIGPVAQQYVLHMGNGVSFFYLLSAYTLCLSCDRRSGEGVASFYARRLFRIAPLFYTVMLARIALSSSSIPLSTVLLNTLFIFNFFPVGGQFRGIPTASWSIGVEMPFYLVFPFLLRGLKSIPRTSVFLGASLAASYAFRLWLGTILESGAAPHMGLTPGDVELYSHMSLITNLPYFIMGILAYQLSGKVKSLNHPHAGPALLIVSVLGLAVLPNVSGSVLIDLESALPLNYLMAAFFIPMVLGLSVTPVRLIVNRLTILTGEISYSVYLFHSFVIAELMPWYRRVYSAVPGDMAAFACCLAATVAAVTALSLLTYNLVEYPGIRMGQRLDRRIRATVGAAGAAGR